MREPNHICKNKSCHFGENGLPKHYYACNDCDRINSWRAACCSPECYQEYLAAIEQARSPIAIEQGIAAEGIEKSYITKRKK